MNTYLEILFWTITIYIISVAVVHFMKVLREKRDDNNINLTKAVLYLSGGILLAMLLLYKPFGEGIIKISDKITEKIVKRPVLAATEAVMVTTTTMGSSVSV